jgi:hypothetical protein
MRAPLLTLTCIVSCLLCSACRPTTNDGTIKPKSLSTVDDSLSLADLRTNAPFRAEVVAVSTQSSANLLAGHAGEQQLPTVTNFFELILLDKSGVKRVFGGVNAAPKDLDAIGQLKQGNTYTFPDVLGPR